MKILRNLYWLWLQIQCLQLNHSTSRTIAWKNERHVHICSQGTHWDILILVKSTFVLNGKRQIYYKYSCYIHIHCEGAWSAHPCYPTSDLYVKDCSVILQKGCNMLEWLESRQSIVGRKNTCYKTSCNWMPLKHEMHVCDLKNFPNSFHNNPL